VIVGAMALLTLLPTLRYRKLENALLSSAGAIQSARYQALSTGVPYQITFNHTTGTYQFLACSNCAGTIYNPTSAFTYAAVGAGIAGIPSGPVPFSVVGGATLAADQTIYFRPGGAVQWVADGTMSCSTPLSMTFSYQGVSKTLTVECYGKVTVP
jgi:Tfp pilus assembly protein FimT